MEAGGDVLSDRIRSKMSGQVSDLVWLYVTEGYTEVYDLDSWKMEHTQSHSTTQVYIGPSLDKVATGGITTSRKCRTFIDTVCVTSKANIFKPFLDSTTVQDNIYTVYVKQIH